jgi:butyrate kinase
LFFVLIFITHYLFFCYSRRKRTAEAFIMKKYRIFVINPGSTSTKLALFEDRHCCFETCVNHDAPELLKFPSVNDQLPLRMKDISDFLRADHICLDGIDAVVARGGGSYSMPGGVYEVDERLIADTRAAKGGLHHPSNLGVQMAQIIHEKYGGRMLTVNPPVVDELSDLARMTGLKGVYRKAKMHVLNLKETAIRHAESMGRKYEDCNFIVCHIDGGISVTAHEHGRIVDANDASGGEGPFTPTRTGGIAVTDLIEYCRGKNLDDVMRTCISAGGFVSHLGTSDSDRVHRMVEEGDPQATRVWNAMIYQIVKYIGAMSTVLGGRVDGILLGGRLLRFDDLVRKIREQCGWIAPVTAYPGEFEQEALCFGALRVLKGEEEAKKYSGVPVWSGFQDAD